MPYVSFGLAIFFAILWYRAGELEASMGGGNPGLIWALLSLAASAIVFFVLHGGVTFCLLAQLLLLVGIGVVRAVRSAAG